MALVPSTSRGSTSAGGVTVLSYVEWTTSVPISPTTAATATTVVTAAAITGDGSTQICIEGFSPSPLVGNTATARLYIALFDGSTQLGVMADLGNAAAAFLRQHFYARRYLTPSAASHTYSLRAYRFNTDGDVTAGVGGSGDGVLMPGYIRITSGS